MDGKKEKKGTFVPSTNTNSSAVSNWTYGPHCLENPSKERELWENDKLEAKKFDYDPVNVQPVNNDKSGAYYIRFSDNAKGKMLNRKQTEEKFYGLEVTDFEAFRLRGNLPDNGILSNKLINTLGRNLVDLEQEIEHIDMNENITKSRKASMIHYLKLECESNAYQIAVIDALSVLEQAKVDGPEAFKGKLAEVKKSIEQIYTTRLARIQTQISNTTDKAQKKQLVRFKKQIEQSKTKLLAELNNPKPNLRTIYRRVMDNYNNEQVTVSIFQRRPDRPFTYANESKTEAFQNASYTISDHIFSPRRPTEEQLWKQKFEEDDLIVLDTRQYPGMRVKDALRTACFLGRKRTDRTITKYNEEEKKILEESKNVKEETHTSKLKIAAARNKDAHKKALQFEPTKDQSKELFKIMLDNATNGTQNNIDFCKGTARVVSQSDIPLYHANDILSSISLAMNDFGLYFEKMSAKSPVKTGFFFCMMSLTFGAAGFAAMPAAKAALAAHQGGAGAGASQGAAAQPNSAALFLHDMCNFLTLGGHTMPADQLQNIITGITHEWNVLTCTNEASSMSLFIMDVFALPKIIYFVLDEICNSPEHKTTVDKLTKQFEQQAIVYKGPKDQYEQYVAALAACTVAVSLAVMIGIGFEEMTHIKSTAAVAEYLRVINEANTSVITGVAQPNLSQLQEFLACVSLVLTVKTAGLFLLKIGLVLNHLVEHHVISDKEKEACEFMAGLKDAFDRGREFSAEDMGKPEFQHYRALFESAIEKHPELATSFGDSFLVHIGAYAKPESLTSTITKGLSTVGNTVVNQVVMPFARMALAPVELIYSVVTSPISSKSRKWLTDSKFDPNGTKLAWRNLFLAISLVPPAFFAAGKTFANAIGGSITRILMEATSMAVDVVGFAAAGWRGSKIFENPILNGLTFPIRGVVAVASAVAGPAVKVGLSAISIATTLFESAGKIVLAAASVVPVVAGAIAATGVWIAALRTDDPDGFRDKYIEKILNASKYIWKHGGDILSKGCNFIRDNCLNGTNWLDDKVYHQDEGGAKIQDMKDAAVEKTLHTYERFKRACGLPIYWLRNAMIRTQQGAIQKSQISEQAGEVKENWDPVQGAMKTVKEGCVRIAKKMGFDPGKSKDTEMKAMGRAGHYTEPAHESAIHPSDNTINSNTHEYHDIVSDQRRATSMTNNVVNKTNNTNTNTNGS